MSNPWKACDLRGVHPVDVSADLFRRLGTSFASSLPVGARVLIAGDFRASTPSLKAALAEGLLESGAHVLDSGQIPTPIAYFAHQRWKTDAIMIVTASHNPPEYNGLKLMMGSLPPTPGDLGQLRRKVEEGICRKQTGKLERIDPVPLYKAWVLERWGRLGPSSREAVVLDAGNGAWSELGPAIFEALGFRVHPLFCRIDSSFPHRSPDCAQATSLAGLRSEVVRASANLGIAWDGDGDRVAFVDPSGSIVSADEVSALMIRDVVPREPQARVVYDIKLSDIVRQAVSECGGQPMMQRSGHAFIKRTMIEQNALFGCEASGHYFFRELNGGDDGLFAALFLTDVAHRRGLTLTELRRTIAPFFVTPDLRIPSSLLPYHEIVKRFRSVLPATRETTIDGVRWENEQGYILARESVTEPVVTMRVEGHSRELLWQLIDVCLGALPEAAGEISRQIDQARDTRPR